MKLGEYFEQAKGVGVLATTDMAGQVNQALYERPYFPNKDDEGTCAFIMVNRLTHDNVWRNPSAAYLFIEHKEDGSEYAGKRLSLTVIDEESDPEKIREVLRHYAPPITDEESRFLVYFHVEAARSLVGNEP